jgi:hypothetical protein
MKLSPGIFYKQFGFDANDLKSEEEFNKENLKLLQEELECKK